jgi:ABC-2 type transport system permease protein
MKKTSLTTILTDTITVFWGEWLDLRVRILPVAAAGLVSPVIYILAFGFGLGSSLPKPAIGGNYLEFMLPGMVALSSMTVSFTGTVFSICGERLFTKTFEELLLLPVHPLALHAGTQKLVFLNPLFLLVIILNSAVFAGLGVIVGLTVKSLEFVGLYNNFLITPMSFLGATFFDPASLPVGLKGIVYLLPLTYASIGLRAAAYDVTKFPWYSIPVLLVAAIAFSLIGARQFSTQQD